MIRCLYFLRFVFIFLKDLVKSNIEVSILALSPRPRFKPGFLAIPMDSRTDFEITSLANSITLTPGTIAVHVEREEHLLVIHVLNVGDDPEAVRRQIGNVLETNILKWARGAGEPPPLADESPLDDPQGGSA